MASLNERGLRGQLDGAGRERVALALLSGYSKREKLDALLDYGLNKRPDDFPGAVDVAVQKLVTVMNDDSAIAKLIEEAAKRSGNVIIAELRDEYFSFRGARARGAELEGMVTSVGFADLDAWLTRATEIKAQVCQVQAGRKNGTGFLVGPDLVLTNYHVIEELKRSRTSGRVRFDFFSDSADKQGSWRELANDWLVHDSPYSAADLDDARGQPTTAELDYALLRTKSRVGEEELPDGHARNWQRLSTEAAVGYQGDPLVIVQHPGGGPLRMAIDTNAILDVSDVRARYRTNTLPGSSGSPCFDLQWQLVALHHSGDNDFKPKWNEGIPVGAIARALAAIGVKVS
jgi:V8-like Glu-specific endopeptidase